jgi:hypothetical protein
MCLEQEREQEFRNLEAEHPLAAFRWRWLEKVNEATRDRLNLKNSWRNPKDRKCAEQGQ